MPNEPEPTRWALIRADLKAIFDVLFPMVSSGAWVSLPKAEQEDFAKTVTYGRVIFEDTLRPPFDVSVNEGHANGKVSKEIVPLRAKRADGSETPGRKAPTPDEVLARKLAKHSAKK